MGADGVEVRALTPWTPEWEPDTFRNWVVEMERKQKKDTLDPEYHRPEGMEMAGRVEGVRPCGRTITICVDRKDAQALYDHTGTMPWAPGSWSHNVRAALSEALATT